MTEGTKSTFNVRGNALGAIELPDGSVVQRMVVESDLVIISPTITVSASPDYSAGDSLGGKITLANALREAGKPAVLEHIHIRDAANQKPTGSILFFNADPAAATITDNAAFVYSTDFAKQIARIPVVTGDYATIDSKATAMLVDLDCVLLAAAGVTLYAAFVLDNTPNLAATTDISIAFGLRRN